MKKNTTNQFLIGSWVSFYPFDVDSYEYQLDQMHRVGLNFNIFPAVFGGGMLDAETWENVEKQYASRNMYYCRAAVQVPSIHPEVVRHSLAELLRHLELHPDDGQGASCHQPKSRWYIAFDCLCRSTREYANVPQHRFANLCAHTCQPHQPSLATA